MRRHAAAWQQHQQPVPFGLVQCSTSTKHAQLHRDAIKWKLLELNAPASASIPAQHLWQTSRTSKLGVQATAARKSWFKLNPGLKYNLHNDSTAAQFMQDFYGMEVYAVYQCLPFGVMRADFWRYAVLYAYGGIYADIDVECLRPIQQWLPTNNTFARQDSSAPDKWSSVGDLEYNKLTWDNCSIVIGMENDLHLCQWTLASAPGHPVLRHVITRVVQGAKQGINATYDNVVHQHTGPAVFTVAVADALGLAGHQSAVSIAKAVWTNATIYKRARALGLCIADKSFFAGQNARNLYGSQFFNTTEYPSWLQEHAANKMLMLASSNSKPQSITSDQFLKHRWHQVTLVVVALLVILCGIQLPAVKTKVGGMGIVEQQPPYNNLD
eukprot:gene9388-biopygen11258